MSESRPFQIRVNPDLQKTLDSLQARMHADSLASTIKSSIALTDMITEAMSNGDIILIKKKGGEQYRVMIPGMTP
jgi:hypothetical protein